MTALRDRGRAKLNLTLEVLGRRADGFHELRSLVAFASLGDEVPVEKRPFHPHLTVARSDPPLTLPAAYTATELESDEWEVGHVILFRSHLGRPAPRYEPLARFPLRS